MAYAIRINGQLTEVDVDGDTPMLWVLRDVCGLTGTKFGCGAALCGACTIHVGGQAKRSCVTPISSVESLDVRTIESLHEGRVGTALQRAWKELEVVQCGYCQPGQLMSAAALLSANAAPTDANIDAVMSGNICRCGTYGRIRKAIRRAVETLSADPGSDTGTSR